MYAVFIESTAFERQRERYLNDDGFRTLQNQLIVNPEAGKVIPGTGGLRKLRFADARRSKGKRGGLRVIYYFWIGGPEFWLMKLYDKDEATDLSQQQRQALAEQIKANLKTRAQRENKEKLV